MYSTMGNKGIPIDVIKKPVEIKITVDIISSNNEKVVEFEDYAKFFTNESDLVTFINKKLGKSNCSFSYNS